MYYSIDSVPVIDFGTIIIIFHTIHSYHSFTIIIDSIRAKIMNAHHVMSCDFVGLETMGIFRRAAGKSRVGVLRGLMEMNPGEKYLTPQIMRTPL